jgi:hypothetical protein
LVLILHGNKLYFVELKVDDFGGNLLALESEVGEQLLFYALRVSVSENSPFLGLHIFLDADVDGSSFAVQKPADGLCQNVSLVRIVRVFVVLVLLDQRLRLLNYLVFVKVGPAAEVVTGCLGILDLSLLIGTNPDLDGGGFGSLEG